MTGSVVAPVYSTISGGTVMSPVTRCSSEWQRPEAASLTTSSPCLGGSRMTSSTLQGVNVFQSTAAGISTTSSCARMAGACPAHVGHDHPRLASTAGQVIEGRKWHGGCRFRAAYERSARHSRVPEPAGKPRRDYQVAGGELCDG